ncbi:MAG: ATP-binding cassette domain-containing protein [Rubrimonas sp.]
MTAAGAVRVRNLWMAYGRQTVLENISLDVAPGSFVSLVGPSGCGKSTFLRLLLSQERPTRGAIEIDGAPLDPEPQPDRGVVFQRYSVFPHLTAVQNVALGLELRAAPILGRLWGRARARAFDQARAALDRVGLGPAADKYPEQLSGGMRQRLALAQTLILRPRILLLDEPFGALDPGIRADIHDLMLDLWWETRMTVFMVSHDLREAFHLGTRIIAFDRPRPEPEYGARVTFDMGLDPADPIKARLREAKAPDLQDLAAAATVEIPA